MGKVVFIIFIIIAISLIFIINFLPGGFDQFLYEIGLGGETKKTIYTEKAKHRDISVNISTTGKIIAARSVNLYSFVSGQVETINKKVGERVSVDDVIITLKSDKLEGDVKTAKVNLEKAEAELKEAELNYKFAESLLNKKKSELETNEEIEKAQLALEEALLREEQAKKTIEVIKAYFPKIEEAFKKGLTPIGQYSPEKLKLLEAQNELERQQKNKERAEQDLNLSKKKVADELKTLEEKFETAKARFEVAKKAVDVHTQQLKMAESELSKLKIKSPINGIVTKISVVENEFVSPGSMGSPQTSLAVVSDISKLYAEAEVDESDVVAIGVNKKAAIYIDAIPDLVLQGKVDEIAKVGEKTEKKETSVYKVKISFDLPNRSDLKEKILVGLSTHIDIYVKTEKNVLTVPIQSVLWKKPSEVGIEADKREKFRECSAVFEA